MSLSIVMNYNSCLRARCCGQDFQEEKVKVVMVKGRLGFSVCPWLIEEQRIHLDKLHKLNLRFCKQVTWNGHWPFLRFWFSAKSKRRITSFGLFLTLWVLAFEVIIGVSKGI